jgi:phytoene dehydrogenase-like protein
MAETYDAIGHNGLTCAAYLAKAGKKVLVLERRHVLGGAAVTEEIFPGFKYSVCSYVVSLLRPEVVRELDLGRHGLQVLPQEFVYLPMEDGDRLITYGDPHKTREEFRRFSKKDADVAGQFEDMMYRMAFAVKPILGYKPPNMAAPSLRDLRTLKEFGGHLNGLGKDTFHQLTKIMTMSADAFVGEFFETPIIRAMHSLSGVIGTMLGPKSPGTAYVLLHHYMGDLDGAFSAWGAQKGGTGAVSEAIASAARSRTEPPSAWHWRTVTSSTRGRSRRAATPTSPFASWWTKRSCPGTSSAPSTGSSSAARPAR